jgi:hypothetical protein
MREAFCFVVILTGVVVMQTAAVPAYLPPVLRPDVGILAAIAVLAFGRREAALVFVFCAGFQADLFGSSRFGLLTLCYLFSSGIILLTAWRELTRGDVTAAWAGGLAGTVLAHTLYVVIGRMCGLSISSGHAAVHVASLVLAACLWGLPCAWLCGKWMRQMNVLSLQVRYKWIAAERLSAARRAKVMRAS